MEKILLFPVLCTVFVTTALAQTVVLDNTAGGTATGTDQGTSLAGASSSAGVVFSSPSSGEGAIRGFLLPLRLTSAVEGSNYTRSLTVALHTVSNSLPTATVLSQTSFSADFTGPALHYFDIALTNAENPDGWRLQGGTNYAVVVSGTTNSSSVFWPAVTTSTNNAGDPYVTSGGFAWQTNARVAPFFGWQGVAVRYGLAITADGSVPVATNVVLTNYSLTNGNFTLGWDVSPPATPVDVQRRESLSEGVWSIISTADTSTSFTDTNAPVGKAFYRVVVP